MEYAEAAFNIIQDMHPGGCIVAEGGVYRQGDDTPVVSGHTIVIDLAGQGQDLRVYEVMFHPNGDGVVYLAASNTDIHEHAYLEGFRYDLVDGNVTNVRQ
jgi:hypothetical protein